MSLPGTLFSLKDTMRSQKFASYSAVLNALLLIPTVSNAGPQGLQSVLSLSVGKESVQASRLSIVSFGR